MPLIASQSLALRYAGTPLLEPIDIEPPLLGDTPFWVQLRYDARGLHLSLNGSSYVEALAVPGWAPKPHWAAGVGAFSSEPEAGFVGIDEVSVLRMAVWRGSAVWPIAQPVRVSLNGQQLSPGGASALSFVRFGAPSLRAVSPAAGPAAGGTTVVITGANLRGGDDYRCKFGDIVVPATYTNDTLEDVRSYSVAVRSYNLSARRYVSIWQPDDTPAAPWRPSEPAYPASIIHCVVPAAASMALGPVTLQVTPNAQQYYGSLSYVYFDADVAILGMSPTSGPELGGTRVAIGGAALELGSHYVCDFNGTVVPSTMPAADRLECYAPATAGVGTDTPVLVSLNAQQFVRNASEGFTYYEHSHVGGFSPTSGPAAGGTLVNISGVGFGDGSHYVCAFGAEVVVATNSADGVISCFAPAATAGLGVSLEVSLNAQQYTVEGLQYHYHGVPVVSGFSPSSGPSSGATHVVVSGSAFGNGSDYRCKWGSCGAEGCESGWSCGSCVVNGTFAEDAATGVQTVTCDAPPLSGVDVGGALAASVLLEVSLNSQEYTQSNASLLSYSYYVPPVLTGVSPALGPHLGSTRLRVYGSALDGLGSHYVCRFNESETPAALDDAGTGDVLCQAAPSGVLGNAKLRVSLNGQQFEASDVQYGYYLEAQVASIAPDAGPTVGGTTVIIEGVAPLSSGDSMTPDYRCDFGYTVLPAQLVGEALTCVTPAGMSAGTTAVEVSLNGQNYSSGSGVTYTFVQPPDLTALANLFGGRRLDTDGEAADATNAADATDATDTADSVDRTGDSAADDVVEVVDGGGLLDGRRLTAHALAQGRVPISPSSGPLLGDTLLSIYIPNYGGGSGYRCKFLEGFLGEGALPRQTVFATYDAVDQSLRCYTPPLPRAGAVDIQVSLNAQNFQRHPLNFTAFEMLELHSLSPATGPERGNTTVLVTGATFDSASPDTDYVCRFGGASRAALVAPATWLNASVMMCASPAREAFLPQTVSPPLLDIDLLLDELMVPTPPGVTHRMRGDAVLTAEALQLTDANKPRQQGAFAAAPPRPELPIVYMTAEFDLLLGGGDGDGGDGVQAYFGTPPGSASGTSRGDDGSDSGECWLASWPACDGRDDNGDGKGDDGDEDDSFAFDFEAPRPDGVGVLLYTGSHYTLEDTPARGYAQQLRIFHDGKRVWQQDVNGLRTNLLQLVTLEVYAEPATYGVRVQNPSSGGGHRGGGYAPPRVLLRVSLDGSPLTDPIELSGWRPQPHWRFGVMARAGDVSGDRHWLRALRVTASHLPNVASVPVRVAANAQQFSTDDVVFTYYGGASFQQARAPPQTGPLTLSSVSPASGPVAGSTAIVLSGANMHGGDDYRCRFDSETVVPASYAAAPGEASWRGPSGSVRHPAGHIRCVVPSALRGRSGTIVIEVSPNAQQYAGQVNYTYTSAATAILGLSPTSGPVLGGTRVAIGGAALELGSHYVCDFNGTVVPAGLAPSSVAQYVAFTNRHVGAPLPQAPAPAATTPMLRRPLLVDGVSHRALGLRAQRCDSWDNSDFTDELERVSAAVAACEARQTCEAVYYNECDEPPYPLYLCPLTLSYADDAATPGCPFLKIESFDRVEGVHCLGKQYGSYSSVQQAVAACSNDPNCGAVYDHQCDGSGGDVYLCPKRSDFVYEAEGFLSDAAYEVPTHAPSGRGSCIYFRPPRRQTINCSTVATVPHTGHDTPVLVSLNAQQFVRNASEGFTYYEHSHVGGFSPTSGPAAGGTLVNISGVGFGDGSHYVCAFGAEVVVATNSADGVISCFAPAATAGLGVSLEVSLNAQQYTVEGLQYHYHGVPVVSGFSPSSGPSSGATHVVVSGSAFGNGSDYRCKWGSCGAEGCESGWSCGSCVVNGTFAEDAATGVQTVTCDAPPLSGVDVGGALAASVLLEVSLNSQEYTQSNASLLSYSYYVPPVLTGVSPALGPHLGSTRLRVYGSALDGLGSHYVCRFNESETPAALDDAGTGDVLCQAAPSGVLGNAKLRVSLNGQQFEASDVQYGYYEHVELLGVSPSAGPSDGATKVVIDGRRFASGDSMTPDYRCAFGDDLDAAIILPAQLVGEALTCVTPSLPAGATQLRLTLNGQDYANSSVVFDVLEPAVISSLSPAVGPFSGGTYIIMSGSGLGGGPDSLCRFTNGSYNDTTAAGNTAGGGAGEAGSGFDGSGDFGSGDFGSGSGELDTDGGGVAAGGESSGGGALVTTRATYIAALDALACYSPPDARAPVNVTLNGQQYVPTDMAFYPEPSIATLSPTSGPLHGGTAIAVSGAALPVHLESAARCGIGADLAPATLSGDDGSEARCTAPPLWRAGVHVAGIEHLAATPRSYDAAGVTWHDFDNVPGGATLLGTAAVTDGELRLGGATGAGSALLEPRLPAAGLPRLTRFEASFFVWAPAQSPNQSAYEPRPNLTDPALGLPVTMVRPELQIPPEIWPKEGERDDHETGGGEAASGYSLSFGDLRRPAPTGAMGVTNRANAPARPFGAAGAGRGLRVVFSLSSPHLAGLNLGRCLEDQPVPRGPGGDAPAEAAYGDAPADESCRWRAVRSDVIEVQLDGAVLARVLVARNLSSNCWAKVEVGVDVLGKLSVTHNDVIYINGVQLPPKWYDVEPGDEVAGVLPRWTFGLGASAAPPDATPAPVAEPVRIDNWRLSSDLLVEGRDSVPLRIGVNAQQYTADLPYAYYRPPILSEAVPSSGPSAGGTMVRLYGHGLGRGSHRTCRFAPFAGLSTTTGGGGVGGGGGGPVEVHASLASDAHGEHVRCLTPTGGAINASAAAASLRMGAATAWGGAGGLGWGDAALQPLILTLNGQQYHASPGATFTFTALPAPLDVYPLSGPLVGGTALRVRVAAGGLLGGDRYRCRFDATADGDSGGGGGGEVNITVEATVDAAGGGDALLCDAPPLPLGSAANASIFVAINGQQFSNGSVVYAYYSPPALSTTLPLGGPSDGGTAIRVFGAGLLGLPSGANHTTHCRLGGVVSRATFDVGGGALLCASPPDTDAAAGYALDTASLLLRGDARLYDDDVVRLTESGLPLERISGGLGSIGHALLPVPTAAWAGASEAYSPQRAFRAEFRTYLGMPPRGHGLSFSYGDLAPVTEPRTKKSRLDDAAALLGEAGGGAGLRVLLRTGAAFRRTVSLRSFGEVHVLHDGALLASCPLPLRMPHRVSAHRGTPWQQVVVEYRTQEVVLAPATATKGGDNPAHPHPPSPGLHVSVDGVACVDGMVLPGWRPRPGWGFGWGARAAAQVWTKGARVARGSDQWIRAVHVRGGARVETTPVPLQLTGNLRQWSEPILWRYEGRARPIRLAPSVGPVGGGTILAVHGVELHGAGPHRCLLSADSGGGGGSGDGMVTHELEAAYRTDGTLEVERAAAKQKYAAATVATRVRELEAAQLVVAKATASVVVAARAAEAAAAAALADAEADLGDARADALRTRLDAVSVVCTLPMRSALPAVLSSAAALRVRVTTNGLQFSAIADAPTFSYYAANVSLGPSPPLLVPASGPTAGGTIVEMPLAGLADAAWFAAAGEEEAGSGIDGSGSGDYGSGPGSDGDDGDDAGLGDGAATVAALRADAASLCYFNGTAHAQAASAAAAAARAAAAAAAEAAARVAAARAARGVADESRDEETVAMAAEEAAVEAAAEAAAAATRAAEAAAAATLATDGRSVRCVAPVIGGRPAGATTLELALNGQQALLNGSDAGAAPFYFYDEPLVGAPAPTQGPAAGSTVVSLPLAMDAEAITGVGAVSNASCRFGEAVVDAEAVEEAAAAAAGLVALNCSAPPATAAGAAWQLATGFGGDGLGPGCDGVGAMRGCPGDAEEEAARAVAAGAAWELRGAAEIFGGQLRLTRAGAPALSPTTVNYEDKLQAVAEDDPRRPTTRHGAGSATLSLPRGSHRLFLEVAFRLVVGGGTGGLGFSLSYGGGIPLTGAVGERGAGLGLRLQFLTAGFGPTVRVVYDGVVLGEVARPTLRNGVLTAVRLRVGRDGLTLSHGDDDLFSPPLAVPGWAPQPEWQVVFAAAAAELTDNHWVDDLHVRTGAYVERTPAAVHVALNGQQFGPMAAAPFEYVP